MFKLLKGLKELFGLFWAIITFPFLFIWQYLVAIYYLIEMKIYFWLTEKEN